MQACHELVQMSMGAHVGSDKARVKLERSIYAMLRRLAFTSKGMVLTSFVFLTPSYTKNSASHLKELKDSKIPPNK